MSLINKMLKDLETRQGGGGRADRPIFQDLHSSRSERHRGRRAPVVALMLLLSGVAGIYSWNRWGDNKATVVSATVPMQTLAQTPVAIEQPSVTAPTPAPPVPAATKEPAPVTKPTSPRMDKVDRVGNERSKSATKQASPATPPQAMVTAAAKSETGTGPARIEKTDRPYSAAELAENAFQEAVRLRTQGDAVGAERRVRALLVTDPKHVKARELLTGLYLENGRWLEAQDTLEQGMAQLPAHLAFRYQLARLHLERGEEARAVSLLEAARGPGQTDPELPAFLAALYQRSGRHAEAVKSYQEALTSRPQEGRWWVGLGISLETQKDSDAARTAYRRALDTGRLTSNLARYAEDRLKALVVR